MGDFDEIKLKEEMILKLTQEMEKSLRERKRKNIFAKIKQIEFEQETLIMNYLEKNDESYIKLVNENFDLIINDDIDFVVTNEGSSPFVSYAKELYGEIHGNGFLYFTTKKTNFINASFQSNIYPLSYSGLINYFGETDVFALKKKFIFFGSRVPQRYKGSIDEDGNVNFETTETFFEWDGHDFVNSIIADPFSGKTGKREKFIENRIELKNQIKLFRKKI